MAIVRSIRRVNPIDANKNVATIGVALPLNPINIFQGTPTTREQVKTNLLNLILTEKGERINHPDYGLGIKSLLFEQNSQILHKIVITKQIFILFFLFNRSYNRRLIIFFNIAILYSILPLDRDNFFVLIENFD